jgi:hypothetical protein
MKRHYIIICFLSFISFPVICYSQKITTGFYSGVNFSDIRGQNFGGEWESKPGPVQGIHLGYSFNRSFGIQTGIDFTTIFYEHKSTSYPVTYYPEPDDMIAPYYFYQGDSKMDFSFYRVPLLLTVSIPLSIQFHMKAGLFFSYMHDHSITNNYYYSEPDITKKTDFGYLFSSGISYPISDRFKITFDIIILQDGNISWRIPTSDKVHQNLYLDLIMSFLRRSKKHQYLNHTGIPHRKRSQ